jgi:hypothetical protein
MRLLTRPGKLMNKDRLKTSGRLSACFRPLNRIRKQGIMVGLIGLSGVAYGADPGMAEGLPTPKLNTGLLLQSAAVTQTSTTSRPASWEIRLSDATISRALRRWGEQAGYQVVWSSPKDFPIAASAVFTGDFHDALRSVVESLAQSDSPVMAVYYLNNVVQIVRYSGQATELKGRN